MAISKLKTLSNGSNGSYWKISWLAIDKVLLTIDCVLTLYTEKSYADIGASLAMSKTYKFPITAEEAAGTNALALGYTKIMEVADQDEDISGGEEV